MPVHTTPTQLALRKWCSLAMLVAMLLSLVGPGMVAPTTANAAAAAVVGQGFVVTPADLAYILQQIKIAEAHVANTTAETGPCGALLGSGPNQIASPLLSLGLRTVDGSCNNLQPGQEHYGAADQTFPRLVPPSFKNADTVPPAFGPPASTSYTQKAGLVFDSQPRTISNLIVDQTSTNPAAVAAAGFPVRTQGAEGVVPCTTDPSPADPNGTPDGCVPAFQTLFIENVTTDIGLSPPFNSMFTLFGQFFDHGVDFTGKGGNGTVFVPLKDDDPLVAGPDHQFGTADDLAPNLRFMVLTRATGQPGPDNVLGTSDDIQDATNRDSPFVDQSQTYTSHSSHQVFLREYVNNSAGKPVATGRLLGSADGGMATWAIVKAQARTLLGLALRDSDIFNIPMIAADPYGKFIPGPLRGLPQYVTASGLVEGDLANPVEPPADVKHIETAFLDDIAHHAVPSAGLVPDGDTSITGANATQPAGTYDNEMLDAHFACGDGRCNENIGLTAVHQIFHSEHDRLVGYIKNVLLTDTSPSGIAALPEWQAALGANGWNGERLFQAARFVTEMEYQHLVFEEFARKVQPAINPFQPFAFNQTDVNPAVVAEFAHAVYRFGHSMLTETIARKNADGSRNDIPLLDGFLNPPAYTQATPNGPSGVLTSEEAAGAIIMGMSDQSGNEIDEFVTETLRNHLLGLPLDLAAINMTRARSEGIPSLNNVRKKLFATSNDGQLTPYTNWVNFGLALKHPESLVNFVAAYGKHPTITGQTTLAGRRSAADQIVNGTTLPGPDGIVFDDPNTPGDESADNIFPPTDAAEFMFSTGPWANSAGNVSITGLDDVDLWVGGLAENTNPFGGLLGTTFNYVFEYQLTNLQNGDRLYYLARTPGMNLRTQLEGNSFAELIMRNTNAHTLKADAFATADCKFELGSNPGIAAPINGSTVFNDPLSECDETALLIRMPDGQIRYRSINSIDPPGINGQSVYNGTTGVDRVFGGNDNDTFWGGDGNDIIDGGAGDDVALGGEGNDIMTDLGGADVPKGGPGNDAIDGGIGDDIVMAGEGKDFTNGGANINETFAGAGDDFVIAGQGEDAVFGDSGDDWEEGGDQPDLLIGDSSTLFFDDHNLPGHDILIGQGGDDDYDMEGGDDIGVAGPGVEKNAGAAGYDWLIGLGDPQAQDADLALPLVGVPLPANGVRDRFNEVEALSGWNLNDKLRGDDIVPSQVGGGGFIGCDALDQAGLDRIAGLDALVPPLATPLAPIVAASTTNFCLLTGPFVWGEGNILLGGAGSDLLEGRGADDIIDGDRYLSVRLSIRTNPANPASEIGSTDLMGNTALSGSFGAGTTGLTLQQAVFAGLVDPGNIVAVREILNPGPGTDVDTAVFSGPLAQYTITPNLDGSVTVQDNVGTDGIDTLWNIELLTFADGTISLTNTTPTLTAIGPAAVTAGGATFPLTVNGTNFTSNSVVRVNGTDRATAFVSDTQLTATIQASDIATAGTRSITVFRPAPGGTSNPATLTINNPTPTLTTISPNATAAGGPTFIITVNGTNFVNGSVVQVNGANRTTTFVNSTQLTAAVLSTDITSIGTRAITVFSPAPGGGTSTGATLTITAAPNPAPTITTIAPATVTVNGPAFTLTVNGTGFVNGSTVQVNGANRTTTFVNSTQLTAAIPPTDITSTGTRTITVFSPAPGGGTSAAATLNITNPAPTISTISPTSATAGGAGFTLTVNGSGFVNGSTVQWNGAARTTTFVNSTQLTAAIPPTDIAASGTATVTVFTPAPGGGTSTAATFTINAPSSTVTFAPIADARVRSTSATSNFGTATTLNVDGDAPIDITFLRFDLSSLAGSVQSAKLRFVVSNGTTNPVGVVTKIANNSWTEGGITYNNRPLPTGTDVQLGSYGTTATGVMEITLTPAQITAGVLNLRLTQTSGDAITFASKENGTVANRPQLIITLGAPPAPTPPAAPSGLTATASSGQVALSWNAVAGATSYTVKRATVSGGPYTNVATGLTAPNFVNTGLTNGTTYFFVVSATNGAGEGANSTQASATPTAAPTPPAAPTGLTATAGSGQVALSWNAVAGATSYTVKRATVSGGPYTNVATGLTGTSFTNTGLTNGTTYFFVVSATNGAGEGANSAQASATPTGAATPVTATFGPVADTYVMEANPTGTNTTNNQLKAVGTTGGIKQTFIRFNVTGLSGTVQSVKLRLFVASASVNGGTVFKLTNTTWAESITWNTKPAIDGPQLGSIGNAAQGSFVEITLPAGAVTGNGTYSLAITSTSTDEVAYSSRETTTAANRPQLIIVTQ